MSRAFISLVQGVKAQTRLPARSKGNPAEADTAERLPESLQDAIQCHLDDTGIPDATQLLDVVDTPLTVNACRPWMLS